MDAPVLKLTRAQKDMVKAGLWTWPDAPEHFAISLERYNSATVYLTWDVYAWLKEFLEKKLELYEADYKFCLKNPRAMGDSRIFYHNKIVSIRVIQREMHRQYGSRQGDQKDIIPGPTPNK